MIYICLFIAITDTIACLQQSGCLKHKYSHSFWGYYTSLSNVLITVYFALLFIGRILNAGYLLMLTDPTVELSITLCITVTFLIYHFMLHPLIVQDYKNGVTDMNPYELSNLWVHYVAPISTIIYWLLFSNKQQLTYIDGIKWLVLPLTYLLYIYIRAKLNIKFESGSYYPYPFLDIEQLGKKRVVMNCIVLLIAFMLLAQLVIVFSHIVFG